MSSEKANVFHINTEYAPDEILDDVIDRLNKGEIQAIGIIIIDREERALSYWYQGQRYMSLLGALHSLSFDIMHRQEPE